MPSLSVSRPFALKMLSHQAPRVTLISPTPSTSRSFWWGSTSKRNVCAEYHKNLQAHHRATKHQSVKNLHRQLIWDPNLPLHRYRPSQGWRLSSSWGKPGSRYTKSGQSLEGKTGENSKSDEEYSKDWYSHLQKKYEDMAKLIEEREEKWTRVCSAKHPEMAKAFEQMKRRMEEDPFGALFGSSMRNGVFDPASWFRPKDSTTRSAASNTERPEKTQEMKPNKGAKSSTPIDEAESIRKTYQSKNMRSDASPIMSSTSVKSLEEYEYDPITMRKIPKETPISSAPITNASTDVDEAIDIPVKTFSASKPERAAMSIPAKPTAADVRSDKASTGPPSISQYNKQTSSWLAQEGFGTEGPQTKSVDLGRQQSPLNEASSSKSSSIRIEPSLDRHLRTPEFTNIKREQELMPLKYRVEENRTEDVDLLRASDVRASAGHVTKGLKESEAKKEERRRKLEISYEHQPKGLEMQDLVVAAERAYSKDSAILLSALNAASNMVTRVIKLELQLQVARKKHMLFSVSQNRDNFLKIVSAQKRETLKAIELLASRVADQNRRLRDIRERLDRPQKDAAKVLENEIRAQKAAMDAIETGSVRSSGIASTSSSLAHHHGAEGDMARNVVDFANRDRWYKREAPHAAMPRSSVVATPIPFKGDVASKIHPSAANDRRVSGKATEMQGSIPHVTEADKALIREVRSIYEDTYGTIDTKHRHTPTHESRPTTYITHVPGESGLEDKEMRNTGPIINSQAIDNPTDSKQNGLGKPPSTYKVLAYDHMTETVTIAATTSSVAAPSEAPICPSEALSRLSRPAKFLIYLPALDAAGFEIVAGNNDVLVFKQVRDATNPPTATDEAVQPEVTLKPELTEILHPVNPIDGTTTQTGNFASPTGFVNYDSVLPSTSADHAETLRPNAQQPRSEERVRRQEAVFSGSSRKEWRETDKIKTKHRAAGRREQRQKAKGKFRRAAKRVLWVALWTGGCCYAVGVVAEYLRTGGST